MLFILDVLSHSFLPDRPVHELLAKRSRIYIAGHDIIGRTTVA